MSRVVVLDAGVMIALLDEEDVHHGRSRLAVRSLAAAEVELCASTVTISEALVAPAGRGEATLRNAARDLMYGIGIEPSELTETVAVEIARLRARSRTLKTPDAAVIATARTVGGFALTTDNRLARMDEAVSVKQFLKG